MPMEVDTSGPLQFVTLKDSNSEATVYVRGASLVSFKTAGIEWLGTRGDAKFDGSKKNLSAGLPICFPQFGPGDLLGRDIPNPDTAVIPVHGIARNMDWKLADGDSTASVVVLELTDTEESRAVWPHAFCCRCSVQLRDDKISWSLSVENKSSTACTFTSGIHSYFHTSDIDTLSIQGPFEGCTMMNRKIDPPEPITCTSNEIKITAFTDDIYKHVLPGTITLYDDEKPPLEITSAGGWQSVVVWNPYGDETLGYCSFVCVESVTTEPVVLTPSMLWTATLELAPKV